MPQAEKVVRYIAPKANVAEEVKNKYRQKRVAAYCRVSTQQEEQINSYEVQTRYYTEKINAEPKWKLVRIFADKGISGTSTKHRDEFNKMIRMCKRGRIDMIITKSISRFARNTVDCLKYIRLLKDNNVDVFFEEQGIHSIEKGSEFYITVYGSIAQSESENISANVRWGKEQATREGKVSFQYKNFLGYRKGADGEPEIVPEEAETIRYIYRRFLAGDSYQTIMENLQNKNILTPSGKTTWRYGTLHSILTNERYMGDAVINKTYTVDCISKKTKRNNGERAKYYVENNHPAIIDIRKKLPDAADCKRSNKSAQKPSLANTPRNTLLQSCLSAESAERRIADAHGHPAATSASYGDVSADWITARNDVTIPQRWAKKNCIEQSCAQCRPWPCKTLSSFRR